MKAQSGAVSELRLAELMIALSLATDLGMGQPMEWALRSCLLSVRMGEEMGLGDQELSEVYYLALLRFIGCTAESRSDAEMWGDELAIGEHFALLDSGDMATFMGFMVRHVGAHQPLPLRARTLGSLLLGGPRWARQSAATHCEVAQILAERIGFGPPVVGALWQMFERWDGKGLPRGLKGEELSRPTRLVHVAFVAETFHRVSGVDAAIDVVQQRAGGQLDPTIAERFCKIAPKLLLSLDDAPTWEQVLALEPGSRPYLSDEQFDRAARAIADFVDLKSPYMSGHSSGVSELAVEAALKAGLPAANVTALRRAGLLHDIGRVGISTGIWDKEGPLSSGEWERVRLHTYYTERILSRPSALAQLGSLAALHHERVDGSGYHRGLGRSSLPAEACILAVADAYQAMTQPRPYRAALTAEAAADQVHKEVKAGRLDAHAADAVLAGAGHKARASRQQRPSGLTEREVEVLRLVARGYSNRRIAAELTITSETADHHVQHIYTKIGVSTRAAATLFAMQHSLL